MSSRILCCVVLVYGAPFVHAADAPVDAAARFGARVDIGGMRLSPDGMTIAFITPLKGQGSVLYTQSLVPGSKPKAAFYADGKPMRLRGCDWVSNDRLVCSTYGLYRDTTKKVTVFQSVTKVSAVNADGTKPQPLGAPQNEPPVDTAFSETPVIDWLPDQDAAVLMAHSYPLDIHYGKMAGSNVSGVGVDRIDTLTGETKQLLFPRKKAIGYITDGRGTLRIVAQSEPSFGGRPGMAPMPAPQITYLYRAQGSDDWQTLSTYDPADDSGFRPVAVDHDLNVAYGWKKLDGRSALYSMSLDGAARTQLVVSRPDVDLDSLVRIGRRNRVVAASDSDLQGAQFFAPDIKEVLNTLHQAMPKQALISVVDANVDENKLLILTGGDSDPGAYYILDRQAHSLKKVLAPRLRLEGVTLARSKPVNFPAADGTVIPGSLTLPPGVDDPHGLPAIVMPQGAPSERDPGGFNWLAQYYAARGYVVLQPNFRGAGAYGDAWYLTNTLKSWDTAVSDVVASGKWLVSSGMADPTKLAIVGWSYGGYAALQSVSVDPTVFKAIVAIAPVSDLSALVGEHGSWSKFLVAPTFTPGGADMDKESPLSHVDKFKQPVMLFHGTFDRHVAVDESTRLAAALKGAGAPCDVVTYEDDDHALEDSAVRADMLRKSDAFLRHAFGMSP